MMKGAWWAMALAAHYIHQHSCCCPGACAGPSANPVRAAAVGVLCTCLKRSLDFNIRMCCCAAPVCACTRLQQDCDPALLRRFSRRIEVPLPDTRARESFVKSVLSRPELNSDLSTADINLLAQLTAGYSGSDLKDLCRTAALAPVRDLMQQQLRRKRRRTCCGPQVTSLCEASSQRRSADSYCVAAGSPEDSTGRTAGMGPAGIMQDTGMVAATVGQETPAGLATGAAAAAETGRGLVQQAQQTTGQAAAEVKLRPLSLADFQAALALVKPAAVDAGVTAA